MVGNILVTTRDIKATETILEEHPAALGCEIFHNVATANLKKKLGVGDKYYLGGPESASIEIPPLDPNLLSKFQKIKEILKCSEFYFALEYIKN